MIDAKVGTMSSLLRLCLLLMLRDQNWLLSKIAFPMTYHLADFDVLTSRSKYCPCHDLKESSICVIVRLVQRKGSLGSDLDCRVS